MEGHFVACQERGTIGIRRAPAPPFESDGIGLLFVTVARWEAEGFGTF